jgi:hypothetical protein
MPATKTMLIRRAQKPRDDGMVKGTAMTRIPDPEGLFRLGVTMGRRLVRLYRSARPHCSRTEENEIRPLLKSSIQNRSKTVGSQPGPTMPGAAASAAGATPSDSARSGI